MTFDDTDLIDSLIRDYGEYGERRRKAVLRCNTEYVADLDKRMRQTREELDVVMEAKQNEQYLSGEHELIQWANAGSPPVNEREMSSQPDMRDWSDGYPVADEYIVPQNPTAADWRRAAMRYVETGSKEHYKLMLTLVRLDHPVPTLAREPEPVKTTSKTIGSLTLEDVWYGSRWYILIFTIWAIIIIVSLNLIT
jgi:hypothetical protein